MTQDLTIQKLVRRIHEQAEARFEELHPSPATRSGPRRLLLALGLGAISAAMAIMVTLVTVLGILGFAMEPWSEARAIQDATETTSAAAATSANAPSLVPSRADLAPMNHLHLPSLPCRILACLAELFGVVGLVLARRRSAASRLSASGVLLALAAMLPVIAFEVFLPFR